MLFCRDPVNTVMATTMLITIMMMIMMLMRMQIYALMLRMLLMTTTTGKSLNPFTIMQNINRTYGAVSNVERSGGSLKITCASLQQNGRFYNLQSCVI